MGIKHLNKFLMSNCSKRAISKINFASLFGKTLAIDTSIYIYKFIGDGSLIENMYMFISILKKHNITPIFVFDGKPPEEKKDLINHRKNKKQEAENEYNEIKQKIETQTELDDKEVRELEQKMETLKKQFVRIKQTDIDTTKEILSAYGIKYLESDGEADVLCAKLVLSEKVWGCVSDDMDMFLYGCNRVIRQVSLLNQTCYLYKLDVILKELEMPMNIFRQIMVISGTDYNIGDKTNLDETIKWYYEYQKYIYNISRYCQKPVFHTEYSFFEWLNKNTKYIDSYEKLMKTYGMFIFYDFIDIRQYDEFIEKNKELTIKDINVAKLYEILREDGFIV